jgi:ketosteroid isomerase-like protein
MDESYLINVAKTEFREAYSRGDVDRLLSIFEATGFTDMSEGGPSHYDAAARAHLRQRSVELFAKYSVKLSAIIIEIVIVGETAYDFGWHEFTLTPKDGGETIRRRQRYFELWKKNSSGAWKISHFIDNADIREELGGHVSHWFLGEERVRGASSSTEGETSR